MRNVYHLPYIRLSPPACSCHGVVRIRMYSYQGDLARKLMRRGWWGTLKLPATENSSKSCYTISEKGRGRRWLPSPSTHAYLKSFPSRSIKYAPSSPSGFSSCLPENIAHSIESGSFLRVSSVVL